MGSTVTEMPNEKRRDGWGKNFTEKTYLQFVPGVCASSCTSITDKGYMQGGEGMINSIIALPHIGHRGLKRLATLGEEHRYFPLLRGIVDVPTPGDPVLLCTFGGRQYYLGPLNTTNNVNFNPDKFVGDFASDGKGRKTNLKVTSKAFLKKRISRLHKEGIKPLDFPITDVDDELDIPISMGTAPDMLLEGRHGNSIRIGSRNVNPYIMITNSRKSIVETSFEGSMMSLLSQGSIRQHFPFGMKKEDKEKYATEGPEPSSPYESQGESYKFKLADEEIEKVHRSISLTYKKNIGRGETEAGQDDENIEKTIYDYGTIDDPGQQILINSERITLNARKDSLFLSAFKHLHLGSGNSMTFSTSNNFLFEGATSSIHNVPLFKINSEQAYLDGRKEIVLGNPVLDKGKLHSAVKGEYLVSTLSAMINDIKLLAGATARAIENRSATGESVATITRVIEGLDQTQELMNETVLSEIVSLK